MSKYSDKQILKSWQLNASPWTKAIENGEIQSRIRITNDAIIAAIIDSRTKTLLDAGCGEGWLMRALKKHNIDCLGVDAIPEFVEAASKSTGFPCLRLSYEQITYSEVLKTFDVVVCNFSLLGKESVDAFFSNCASILNTNGKLIVQTVHPKISVAENEYLDGWREGSWVGFSDNFCHPAPWYFRTIDSWIALFRTSGFVLDKIIEPTDPDTNLPVSIIFIGTVKQ